MFVILMCVIPLCVEKTDSEINISHETTTMVVWIYGGIFGKKNYMFRPIAAIFRLLQYCSKNIIRMPILRSLMVNDW